MEDIYGSTAEILEILHGFERDGYLFDDRLVQLLIYFVS